MNLAGSAHWRCGSGGRSRTGPVLAAGTQICAEFNYAAIARPCLTLT
ncbi:hypothetical protein [Streptomyces sp. WM6378]|nr:hypothetical protein [Streptomyces sp. WM6378]